MRHTKGSGCGLTTLKKIRCKSAGGEVYAHKAEAVKVQRPLSHGKSPLVCVYMSICLSMCLYMCVYIYMYICMYLHIGIHMGFYLLNCNYLCYEYLYVYTCMYMCLYMYTHEPARIDVYS